MSIETDAGGWPAAYRYRVGGSVSRIAAEDATGRPQVIHLKAFSPVDDHYGLGCLGAASGAIAIHNAATRWNKALLDNAARPSGALVYDPGDGSALAPAQFERLKADMEAAFSGASNAGRPMLLEGGLKWQAMSLTPADMDFVGLKAAAAREIALAFGVPPMLLGHLAAMVAKGAVTGLSFGYRVRDARHGRWRELRVAGEPGQWRVADTSVETTGVKLELVRIAPAPLPARATPGRVMPAPDAVAGTTILHVFELPHLGEGALAAPRLLIAACGAGAGWRRAALAISVDGGVRWEPAGSTAAPAIIGTVEDPGGEIDPTIIDRRNAIIVELAHPGMMLADADDAALDAGQNLALIGDEFLQFGEAEPLGANRWRLTQLWRGRRGTGAAAGMAAAGDRFVLIETTTLAVHDGIAGIGATVSVLGTAPSDGDGVEATTAIDGASVLPPAPVHLRAWTTAGGETWLRWTRRSRTGWRWQDGTETPLGEETEQYRVRIIPAAGPELVETVPVPELHLPAGLVGPVLVEVRQSGDHGLSPPVFRTI